jgi:MFS family permease
VLPALYSITSFASPPERRGGMMAIASSLTVLGNLVGPLAGGLIGGRFGLASVFLANSILLLGAGLLSWRNLEPATPTLK